MTETSNEQHADLLREALEEWREHAISARKRFALNSPLFTPSQYEDVITKVLEAQLAISRRLEEIERGRHVPPFPEGPYR